MIWLARDEKRGDGIGQYRVFGQISPALGTNGVWSVYDGDDPGTALFPGNSPIKLKPGEGPVKVELVKV